ncbi:unnamed protein product, partial [Scytosiphon promiscuus]
HSITREQVHDGTRWRLVMLVERSTCRELQQLCLRGVLSRFAIAFTPAANYPQCRRQTLFALEIFRSIALILFGWSSTGHGKPGENERNVSCLGAIEDKLDSFLDQRRENDGRHLHVLLSKRLQRRSCPAIVRQKHRR